MPRSARLVWAFVAAFAVGVVPEVVRAWPSGARGGVGRQRRGKQIALEAVLIDAVVGHVDRVRMHARVAVIAVAAGEAGEAVAVSVADAERALQERRDACGREAATADRCKRGRRAARR